MDLTIPRFSSFWRWRYICRRSFWWLWRGCFGLGWRGHVSEPFISLDGDFVSSPSTSWWSGLRPNTVPCERATSISSTSAYTSFSIRRCPDISRKSSIFIRRPASGIWNVVLKSCLVMYFVSLLQSPLLLSSPLLRGE